MFNSPAAKFAAGLLRFRPHSNSLKLHFIRPEKAVFNTDNISLPL